MLTPPSGIRLEAEFLGQDAESGHSRALFVRQVEPQTVAQAGLVFLHGSMIHSEYYVPWAVSAAQRGLSVWLPDLRGHGRSDGPRGVVKTVQDYLGDLELVVREYLRREPERPLFVGGESYGALVAFLFAAQSPGSPVRGIVLSAPAFGLKAALGSRVRQAIDTADRVLPFLRPLRPMTVRGVVRHPHWDRLIRSDRLAIRRYSLHFLAELLRAQREAELRAEDVTVPVLALLAGQDQVVDNQVTQKICRSVKALVIQREFPAAWHALTGEVPDELNRSLMTFIREVLGHHQAHAKLQPL